MTNELIGMILSLCAMTLTVTSYQIKNKIPLLIFQTAGSTVFMISFVFSGGGIGAVLNAIMLVRNLLFIFYKPSTKKQLFILCGALFASYITGYVVYTLLANEGLVNNIWNAVPVIAASLGTIAFTNDNVNMLRVWKYGDSACWLAYNTHIGLGALGAILCEIFSLASLTIGIIRYREKKQKS